MVIRGWIRGFWLQSANMTKKSANFEHSNGSKANFGRILLTKVTKYTSAHCQKWILCFRIDLAVFHDIFHPFRNIFFWIYLSMIPIFWPPRWFELDNPFHTQRCVRTRICTSRWMNMCKSTEFTLTPEFQSEDYRKDRFKYYYVIVLEYE